MTISLDSCVFAVLMEATCIPFYFIYFLFISLPKLPACQKGKRELFVLKSTDASTSIVHHVVVAGRAHLQGETLVSVMVGWRQQGHVTSLLTRELSILLPLPIQF